jgi:hypothetical protein
MKTSFGTVIKMGTCLVCLLAVSLQTALPSEPTAFALVKEGNRYVSQDAKNRLVQIRSDKSVGGLTPNVWYIVYYDPDATAKATEVKFAGGKKVTVKRPMRVLELLTSEKEELPKEKLKVNSDRAIAIAAGVPMLKGLKLAATRLELERWGDLPVWKVHLWAQTSRKAHKTAEIGEVFVAAEDGKVVKNNLDLTHLD